MRTFKTQKIKNPYNTTKKQQNNIKIKSEKHDIYRDEITMLQDLFDVYFPKTNKRSQYRNFVSLK